MRSAFVFFSAASILLALSSVAPAARACDDDDQCSSHDSVHEYQYETAIGVGLDVLHGAGEVGALAGSGGSTWGIRTSMHARLGRRVGVRLGLEESMGAVAAGYKRYDLAWSLPDVYFYLTPKSQIQLFTVLGMDMRVVHFESGRTQLDDHVAWGQLYLGAILGGGIESRLNESTALRFELRGFVRGRAQDKGAEDDLRAADAAFAASTKTEKGVVASAGLVFF